MKIMNSKKPKEEIRKKKQFKIDSFVSLKIIKIFYQYLPNIFKVLIKKLKKLKLIYLYKKINDYSNY